MADLRCKTHPSSADVPKKPLKLPDGPRVSVPSTLRPADELTPSPASATAIAAYEQYIRLPELRSLWRAGDFPNWKNEAVLRPAFQALEITFRLASIVLADPRPYANLGEWRRRVESLATKQIEVIAILCEEDAEARGTAPVEDASSAGRALGRSASSATEVWRLSEETTVVNRCSEESLLPRLADWKKTEGTAQKILYSIECEMRRCPYTLGLGEPNLAGKPTLRYDAVCKPSELRFLRKSPSEHLLRPDNRENQILYTAQQMIESWIHAMRGILSRLSGRIDGREFESAAGDCWLVERIWKLLAEVEDVHLVMDPDDFLRLKSQLWIRSESEADPLCFRSGGLVEIARLSEELKHRVPEILGVEADPRGGPRMLEAAMKLYREKRGGGRIQLLQGLQAVESAVKRFFFGYRQTAAMVMGSLAAGGNGSLRGTDSGDPLSRIFLAPTHFPSLDAAKTFLGDWWEHGRGAHSRGCEG